jgi:quinol monooxygenase YgiN
MGIIVAGKLIIQSGWRDAFVEKSHEAIVYARENQACEDFSVSPDPLDTNRVNVFAKWTSYAELNTFRESDPDNELFSLVELFDVKEYEITP